MTYRITWRPAALRSIDKLDRPVRARILHTIDALATEPRPHGAIALTGGNGDLRVRVGTYRIIYRGNDNLNSYDWWWPIQSLSGLGRPELAHDGLGAFLILEAWTLCDKPEAQVAWRSLRRVRRTHRGHAVPPTTLPVCRR